MYFAFICLNALRVHSVASIETCGRLLESVSSLSSVDTSTFRGFESLQIATVLRSMVLRSYGPTGLRSTVLQS